MAEEHLLRQLRNERHLSLEYLAGEAGITTLALSNVELHSSKPQRDNLLRILDVLEKAAPLSIGNRKAVLESFGYTDNLGLPNQLDIDRAIDTWRQAFNNAPYPAYLVDIAQRIHDWNRQAMVLLNRQEEDLAGLTLFDLMFDLPTHGDIKALNHEEIVKKTIPLVMVDYLRYGEQDWCGRVIAEAEAKYPAFRELWPDFAASALAAMDLSSSDITSTMPVMLVNPAGDAMNFQVVGIDMVSDPRFRVVQYVPLDMPTMENLMKMTA